MTTTAEKLLSHGKLSAAAAYAQMAADYAWHNHPGMFSSPRLEQVLSRIGSSLDDSGIKAEHRPCANPRSVLHVLTQAYAIGGSTRFIWRWIDQDPSRQHSVAITRQQDMDVPRELSHAAKEAHGGFHLLDNKRGDLLARARRLRNLARFVERVVLHVHPYDVVPSIAFSGDLGGPPVVSVIHADHLFWVGRDVSNTVAHIRASGRLLSVERRGLEPEKCFILPIPLSRQSGAENRIEARKSLGLEEDNVLLLSVASAYKYAPMDGPSIVEMLDPVLRSYPKAVLYIVGAGPDEKWARISPDLQAQTKLWGVQNETSTLYAAADIYLDSFPFASLTSLLEAGARGTPVVSYRSHPESCSVLCSDDPALPRDLISCSTPNVFRDRLDALIEDPTRRATVGETIRQRILSIHADRGWRQAVEKLFAAADCAKTKSSTSSEENQPRFDELDKRVALMQLKAGLMRDEIRVTLSQIGLLPLSSRTRVFLQLLRARHTPPHFLFSESFRTHVRKSIFRVRKAFA